MPKGLPERMQSAQKTPKPSAPGEEHRDEQDQLKTEGAIRPRLLQEGGHEDADLGQQQEDLAQQVQHRGDQDHTQHTQL